VKPMGPVFEEHPTVAPPAATPLPAARLPRRPGSGSGGLRAPTGATFDPELIRRYDRPGPRYTSYPTAPCFDSAFGEADHRRLLAQSAELRRPLALYVHIPFCRRRCFFCGCNVAISRDQERALRYLDSLEREASEVAAAARAARRPVAEIHWGGGTPTFLPPQGIEKLSTILRRAFPTAAGAPLAVEVDPRWCSEAQLDALAEAGMRRLSAGVQDLDPVVQQAINRVQPFEQLERVVTGARARGVDSVNVDLIYGLPHQTPEGFAAALERVLELAPERLAIFSFAFLPETFRHQQVIDPEALPDAAGKLAILERAVAVLERAGYLFIGMDHFARPEDSLARALEEGTLRRGFQGYSAAPAADLLGLGVSAISELPGGFVQNAHQVEEYRQRVAASGLATERGLELSEEDRLRGEIIQALMCRLELRKADIESRFGVVYDERFAAELAALEPLAADGLVELHPDRLAVTPRGRYLVRNLAMAFDAHLPAQRATRFSRTV
jgi:oxygen-independent coproporphyrinogen III oxidase